MSEFSIFGGGGGGDGDGCDHDDYSDNSNADSPSTDAMTLRPAGLLVLCRNFR